MGSVTGCGKGKYLLKSLNPFDWSCLDCPVGKYSNEDNYSNECKSCPAGSVPVLDSGVQGSSGSTGCQYCGRHGWRLPNQDDYGSPFEPYVLKNNDQARYSDGIRCRNCPPNSKINCNVLRTQFSNTPPYYEYKGGRSINDCICDVGYIKEPQPGGGFKCTKCEKGMYPNKPADQSPDKCVKRGDPDCPEKYFNFGYCNIPDGEFWDGPDLETAALACHN